MHIGRQALVIKLAFLQKIYIKYSLIVGSSLEDVYQIDKEFRTPTQTVEGEGHPAENVGH